MASLNHGVSFSTVSIQPLSKNIGKRIQEGQRKSSEALSPPSCRCHRIRDHLSSPVMTPMRRVHLRTPVQHQFARRASCARYQVDRKHEETSDISAPAQAELRRWSQQWNFHKTPVRSFRAVGAPIWLAMPCQKSTRPHCSSPAATMTLSSS